jgi:hypothetical protein
MVDKGPPEADRLIYWRLCDELTVLQAAMLIAGLDPADELKLDHLDWDQNIIGLDAAKAGIGNALRNGAIKGRLHLRYVNNPNVPPESPMAEHIDFANSRVEVNSLKAYLSGRGLKTGFFFPEGSDFPDYLDPTHPRYAPKLAAAVLAWKATGDDATTKGKTPKQALIKWLREHASEFDMTDDDGKPNETGIEEAAKMANWQPTGGAPKTPGG